MKTKLRAFAVAAWALVVASSANAEPYTNFLNDVYGNLQALSDATSSGGPAANAQAHKLLVKATNEFNADSSSVAGDYGIFVSVVQDVLPLQGAPGTESLSNSLSQAFQTFANEAGYEIAVLSNRVAAITPFQKSRRAASNNVAQAQAALTRAATTTNVNIAILNLRLAYQKITVASKLTAKAESKQGDAPNSLAGGAFAHTEKGDDGTPKTQTISFTDGSNYTQDDPSNSSGTYTWTRTGLDTGTLVLNGGSSDQVTVQIKFLTSTNGTFSYTSSDRNGKGTFTFAP